MQVSVIEIAHKRDKNKNKKKEEERKKENKSKRERKKICRPFFALIRLYDICMIYIYISLLNIAFIYKRINFILI